MKKNKLRIEEEKMAFKEKCEFRTRNSEMRNFRIPVVLQDREHVFFGKWS